MLMWLCLGSLLRQNDLQTRKHVFNSFVNYTNSAKCHDNVVPTEASVGTSILRSTEACYRYIFCELYSLHRILNLLPKI